MGMILRIASSRIVGQGDIVGRSGYFSLNLSANSVMRGRLDARRTLKSLVADLRKYSHFFERCIGLSYKMSFLYKVISHAVQSKCSWNFCPLYNRVRGSGNLLPAGVFLHIPSI